ncbi:hypothetical protein [Terrimonas ferruginea]|nr:hypothetical protein [Terrimonas ferruginea]
MKQLLPLLSLTGFVVAATFGTNMSMNNQSNEIAIYTSRQKAGISADYKI